MTNMDDTHQWSAESTRIITEPEALSDIPRREFLKRSALAGGSLLALSTIGEWAQRASAASLPKESSNITPVAVPNIEGPLQAKNFDANFATIEGLSTTMLKQHVGLYNGYVQKLNDIQIALSTQTFDLSKSNGTYSPFRALHVEQSFALNGVVLHELYFENLGGSRQAVSDSVKNAIICSFGTWQNYMEQLKALGKSARGWVITGYNRLDGRIHLYGLDAHNQGVPMKVTPLLVLDVYEHAYMLDFGTNRGSYLDAFMANINWAVVYTRLDQAHEQFKHAY